MSPPHRSVPNRLSFAFADLNQSYLVSLPCPAGSKSCKQAASQAPYQANQPAPRSSAIHRPIRPLPVGVQHARLTLVSVLALTLTHSRPPTVAGFPFPSLLPLPSSLPFFLLLPSIFSHLNLTHHSSSQLIDSNQGSLVSSIGPLTSSYSLPSQRVFHHLYHLTREPPPLTLNPRAGSRTHHADSTTTHQRTKLACDKAVYSLL
jgi:hypothetical protein